MPLHMESLDVSGELEDARSVLIVSCPICPPINLAIRSGSPLIDLFKWGLRTPAFEELIEELRRPLERRGARTGVFCIYTPCPTMCLWTEGQRRRLRKRARDYEAVLVLGCGSATRSVRRALEDEDCRVVQAMRTTGLINATTRIRFPMTVHLEAAARTDDGVDEVDA